MQFKSNVITFLRGDDDALLVGLTGDDVFEAGDKVYFSVKTKASDTADILQIMSEEFQDYTPVGSTTPKANGGCLINIPHAATIDIPLGNYQYDILIEWSNGTYWTVIPPTAFILAAGGSHGQ